MRVQRYRDAIIDWLAISFAISIFLTGIFWCFYSENTVAKELLGIFGIFITLIGLGIGIDQIARLRNEKEVIQRTRIISKLAYVKKSLENVRENITILTPNTHIQNLNKIEHELFEIDAEQNEDINCDLCERKIKKIIRDLHLDIQSKATETFRAFSYNSNLGEIIRDITNLESKLKND